MVVALLENHLGQGLRCGMCLRLATGMVLNNHLTNVWAQSITAKKGVASAWGMSRKADKFCSQISHVNYTAHETRGGGGGGEP